MRDRAFLPFVLLLLLIAVPVTLALTTSHEPRADFVFDVNSEPETIDPAFLTGQPDLRVAMALFEGLLTRDPANLAPMPGIADRWTIAEDGLTYVFHLRPARWSNGDPVRASDFRFAWERVLTPANAAPTAEMLYPIAGASAFHKGESTDFAEVGVAAPDDTTLKVTLARPTPYFLDLCAGSAFLPVNPPAVRAHGDDWIRPEHVVVNGPFAIADWKLRRRIRLRRNPDYWDAAHVGLTTADAIFTEQASTAFNLYATGSTDWLDSSGIPPMIRDLVVKRPDCHRSPYLNTYFYRVNVTRPGLSDPRVRQALALSIDKQAIVEHITRSGQIPATQFVPPGLPGYTSPPGPGYDPERARALLAAAGYPEGRDFPPIELFFNTSDEHRPIAEVVQQQWKDVLGIRCALRNQEWKVFLASTRALDYDISRASWIGDYLDPSSFLDIFRAGHANNRTGWANPEYDRILDAAALERDPGARATLYARAEALLTDEGPIIPIYFYVTLNCYDGSRFRGCEPNLLNLLQLKYVRRADAAGPEVAVAR
jgi:oligopeptide transport system substrate-binding protein